MRNAIHEYLGLSEHDKQELLQNAFIVFDTNVLLNLYRLSKDTREALLNIMRNYKSQLWMPYQVAVEFMRNRPKVINDSVKKYDELSKSLDSFLGEVQSKLRIKNTDQSYQEIELYFRKWIEDRKNADLLVTDWNNDGILSQILKLYEGKVGRSYSDEEVSKIEREGEQRYKKEIPPGFKDSKKQKQDNNNNAYGDLIYWKQVLDYAKEKQSDVILITGDKKDDWWISINGKTVGPHPLLIKEFSEYTSRKVYMYDMSQFISISGCEVNENVAEEIQEVSIVEKSNHNSDKMSTNYDELKLEIDRMQQRIANKEESMRGFERLILSGRATTNQRIQYNQLKLSYKHDREYLKRLISHLLQSQAEDDVLNGLYWLTK